MSVLGLDIGTYSIKAMSGKPGNQANISRVAEVFNSAGSAVPSDEAVAQKLVDLLETMINDHKLPRNDVRLSLPETVVSTIVIELPVLSDAELASAIGWQAEQHIPIPPERLSLQYQVLYRPDKKDQAGRKMRVLLVGAHKDIVEKYVEMFLRIGIELKLLETQALSILRAVRFKATDPTTLIVHMGASTTQIAMIHQGELQFVTSQMTGGQILTQALEKQIGLSTKQAEEYKRAYGLATDQFQGKVRAVLLPVTDILVNEISKAMTFFTNQHAGVVTQRVLLSGGSVLLPGLVQYLTSKLGIEVLMAAPFSQAVGEIPEANHSIWTVCMGLLMREEL